MATPPSQGSSGGTRPLRDPMQTDKYTQPLTKPTQPQPQPQRYAPAPPTPPSKLTPVKRSGGRWLLLLLVLLLVLGAGIYLALGGRFTLSGSDTEPVASAISGFYSALDTGKCDDARASLANPDMTSQQLCDRWKALKDAGPTTMGAANTVNVSGDTATASWLRTAGGKPNNLTISLRKVNNTWKITTPTSDLLPAPSP